MRAMPVTEITVRRPNVDVSTVEFDKWTVEGDPIFSHFLNSLSAAFPEGEDFFVQSVRQYRDQIADDPELKARVKGFIGQEAMHGREHRALNERFASLGYPTLEQDADLARARKRLSRLPKSLQLATTAASEHFTAVIAHPVLTDERTREILFSHPELAVIIEWHAMEELEHKDVAFDVYEKVSGNYAIRVAGLGTAAVFFGLPILAGYVKALVGDRKEIGWREIRTNRRNYKRQKMVRLRTLWELAGYLKPGFHPNDIETESIVVEWRERLADSMTTPSQRRAS